jgi:hypothetical protein
MEPVITQYPLLTLSSGDVLSLQQYRFSGIQPGHTVYVQANLHGAEIAGNPVIVRLLNFFKGLEANQLRGELRLVPVCNPLGVNTRAHHFSSGRFNPYDGRDWNRIFWDFEQDAPDLEGFARQYRDADIGTIQRAYRDMILAAFAHELAALESPVGVPVYQRYRTRLQQLALDADIVLDLHTSANQGLVYVYYFRDRTPAIPYLGVDFAILLDRFDGNAFDEAFINPWLALESTFAVLGRSLRFDIEAWTLELGSASRLMPLAVERGFQGILNYLRHKRVLTDQPAQVHPEVPLGQASQLTKYFATQGGFVQPQVTLGTWVQTGDPLYDLLSLPKAGQLPHTCTVHAQQSGLVYDLAWNQAVNEGEYVLAIMTPTT